MLNLLSIKLSRGVYAERCRFPHRQHAPGRAMVDLFKSPHVLPDHNKGNLFKRSGA